MKLSASKFNEKNVFRQFQKKKYFSQMSAVRTGVRAYMDATPLPSDKLLYIVNPALRTLFICAL